MNEDKFDEIAAFVKQNRPRALTKEERLDILRLQAYLRFEGTKYVEVQIARMLGRSERVVKEVWKDYATEKSVVVAPPPSNTTAHVTRVPNVQQVVSLVQQFVRQRRETRTRTVAKDVLGVLYGRGFVDFDMESMNDYNACLRSVQRFLLAHGYRRGKKGGAVCYKLSPENTLARDVYVQAMVTKLAVADRESFVYLDESYIHHHYSRHHDTIYDPNDEQDLQVKASNKGRRYCFIAAIADIRGVESKLLCLDIFHGGKKKKETKDYHGMFNHAYFVTWFSTLMTSLQTNGITNATIVLDNAKYHKGLPIGTPKSSWKKADMLQACRRYGLPCEDDDVKSVLWSKLAAYVQANIEIEVVTMAKAAGHVVAFTPPHHSDLQPIELVWAIVKGEVGRQYTTTTKFPDVLRRLELAFSNLTPAAIRGCITASEEKVRQLHNHLYTVENNLETCDSSDYDSDCSDESA